MSTWPDELPQVPETHELRSIYDRIEGISAHVFWLISIALVLFAAVTLVFVALLLSGSPSLHAVTATGGPYGSCMGWTATARVCTLAAHAVAGPDDFPIAGLSGSQRGLLAAVVVLNMACFLLMLLQLRQLFGLYSNGIIFAAENAKRIKWFAVWLMVTTAPSNLSGVIFAAILHGHLPLIGSLISFIGIDTRWLQTLVVGGMIFVIGYVMELGRAADLERKEFI